MIARASRKLGAYGLASLALSTSSMLGCAQPNSNEVDSNLEPLIYGEDDRRDLFESDSAVQELALESTVARIEPGELVLIDDHFEVASGLGSRVQLCPQEAFRAQPTLASCSGVLVDDDLVLTAGHCLDACEKQFWTFGYGFVRSSDALRISRDDVYACRSLPFHAYGPGDDDELRDYSLVQLDRPAASSGQPVTIVDAPPQLGQAVVVIGYPEGHPVKIDRGARVLSVRPEENYFGISSDTYVGSSGSGVFDEQQRLLGVLVRGGSDYQFDFKRRCYISRHLDETAEGQGGEKVVYAAAIISELCSNGWTSERLCGRTSLRNDAARSCSLGRAGARSGPEALHIATFFALVGWGIRRWQAGRP